MIIPTHARCDAMGNVLFKCQYADTTLAPPEDLVIPEPTASLPLDEIFFDGTAFQQRPPRPDGTFLWNGSEWVQDIAALEAVVRNQRDYYLNKSDWTQLPDIPAVTQELWRVYRQALRDLPSTTGYPTSVVWPVEPV